MPPWQDKASSLAMPIFDPVAEERRRRDAEEERLAELRRHGHVVTVEAFAEWKAAFDAEQALERAKLEGDKAEDKKGRPTGKQWFLQQEAAHLEVSCGWLGGGGWMAAGVWASRWRASGVQQSSIGWVGCSQRQLPTCSSRISCGISQPLTLNLLPPPSTLLSDRGAGAGGGRGGRRGGPRALGVRRRGGRGGRGR